MTALRTPALDLSAFAGRRIAVLGLGVSGLSAAKALSAAGAQITAWDDTEARRTRAAEAGIALADLASADLTDTEMLVLSPGIPHGHPTTHPAVEAARRAGCEIVCDVELLTRAERAARYVAITGTNGKSTTTALIGHILQATGERVAVGGNIGAPALDLAPMGADGTYVLELSSYQLELMPEAVFDVAVLLNITPDHLDRHGGMDGYVAAKRRIFRGQRSGATAVIGVDDAESRGVRDEIAAQEGARIVPVSVTGPAAGGVYADGSRLMDARGGGAVPVLDLSGIETLPGSHNAQNAAAAFAATAAVLEPRHHDAPARIAAAIATFPGLAHRQELIGTIDGVRFVNDSKATNADAAARALGAYDAIYWIAGGKPKEGGIASLTPWFGRIRHAFLIGEAEDAFAATLDGKVPYTRCGDLDTAVAAAAAAAREGADRPATVLLSPACASFDQFPNFEVRGEAFRAAVARLDGFTPRRTEGTA